jgi:hypothetical protein
MDYDNITDFFWNTSLSDERKAAIVEWVKSLSKDEKSMLEDIVDDARIDKSWEAETEDW